MASRRAGVVDGERDADLGGGHHIDGVSKRSKTSKMRRRKPCAISMRVEWMFTSVILRLQAMDLTTLRAGHGLGDDARAGHFGPARIQNQHRDVLLDGRHHGGGVQHLGAEIGQFGGFGEGDGLDAMAAGQDGGVGGEHAVHVGPDLDLFGADARAHDGGGEIGAAAAQRGGDAVLGGADEAAHHHHGVVGQRRDGGGEARVGFGKIGRGLGVALVGDDDAGANRDARRACRSGWNASVTM